MAQDFGDRKAVQGNLQNKNNVSRGTGEEEDSEE
jgi:hypothetical protein